MQRNQAPMPDDLVTPQPTRPKRSIWPWLAAAVVGATALALVAFAWQQQTGGDPLTSAQEQAEADAKKKEEEEKQKEQESDPQVERLVILPGDAKSQTQALKPGHWATGSQRMRAVYEDFVGQQDTSVVNSQGEPYSVDGTPLVLESTRPVTLAKGQPKEIDSTFLTPQVPRAIRVREELVERGFGRSLQTQAPVARMPSYQYYFVVLAKEPARYSLLKTLDSVTVPWDGESESDDTDDPLHYRVVSLPVDRAIPLSDNPLTWTSIAYVLWDEVDPKRLTREQAQALVDWLHWGGQLVVNGPDSLDLLKGSFLEPYLPATSGGSRAIAADDLRALNDHWLISTQGTGERLAPKSPWSGIELVTRAPQDQTDTLGDTTGGLLMERNVGRGRIVVSAMQLSEREFVNWRGGFQSLFNGGILRRPQRIYRPGYYGELSLAWADPQYLNQRLDARLTTGLRYLSRDLGVDTNYRKVETSTAPMQPPESTPATELRPPEQLGGIGAWNDFSSTSNMARESLLEAAGVEVPDTSFVVISLALYLVALVPLNWLVFNAIGRVEWAWIAAPIIALIGTWVIIDRARLDIGFVRAQTEIGILELQPNYDRGHLSRYTALYTSLSTTYDLEFDSLTTLAAPFPTRAESSDASEAITGTCTYERYDAARLKGVFVPSNTTNMVHSEQMLVLDGPIRLGRSQSQNRPQIENQSKHTLKSAVLVERTSRAQEAKGATPALRGTWVGELRPGESRPALFSSPIMLAKDAAPFAKERADEERLEKVPRLNMEALFGLALDVKSFEPGEKRLVARIDEVLVGETASPAASQIRGGVLVVAHLDYGPRPEPLPDLNTSRDVVLKVEDADFGN
jgi:hypothetical protein